MKVVNFKFLFFLILSFLFFKNISASVDSLAEAFEILGLEKSATSGEVKKAKQKLLMGVHADRASSDPEKRASNITVAYSMIMKDRREGKFANREKGVESSLSDLQTFLRSKKTKDLINLIISAPLGENINHYIDEIFTRDSTSINFFLSLIMTLIPTDSFMAKNLIELIKDRPNAEIQTFLEKAASKKYKLSNNIVDINVLALTQALRERIDHPGGLRALLKFLKNHLDQYSPNNIPIIILESLRNRNDPEILEFYTLISKKLFTPKTAMELSHSEYIFLAIKERAETAEGQVALRNISKNKSFSLELQIAAKNLFDNNIIIESKPHFCIPQISNFFSR